MEIGREYHFSAAHHLPFVADDHKCRRVHGHNYQVFVTVRGDVAENGFCCGLDFYDIDTAVWLIIDPLDHRNLNDLFQNPTIELVTQYIFDNLPDWCGGVKIWETPTRWAEVSR